MREEEALWLYNYLLMEEEHLWSKFFMRLRGVIGRAIERNLTPVVADEAICSCDIARLNNEVRENKCFACGKPLHR